MATPFPAPTKAWHTTEYEGINPERPELSAAGKTIVITGGGSGIGPHIATAFARAGAANIVILGRTSSTLQDTKSSLNASYPKVNVIAIVADVVDKAAVDAAFDEIHNSVGLIDGLISNAGYLAEPSPVATTSIDDWWKAFETNVKGPLHLAQAFLRYVAPVERQPVIVNVTSGIAHLPVWPGMSSYAASKIAGVKLFDYLGAENPGVRVVSIQPGTIDTAMARKAKGPAMDDASLPAGFSVWLASKEAEFLNRKCVWTNWDVEELKAMADKIKGSDLFTLQLQGIPFADKE